ncbi:MAG: tRNA uridine-5-carboxymethylaminomethyl(34) synthesis GTPase MnmE [Bacteroidetes bacterium]|nr:tRNA uridine-5-carboxymethylaminomethyl(34) synthesis GTPase MnmE [Bacteroidota bacterium]
MIRLTDRNETIVALATPPGVGAISVIRLSGNDAFRIADTFFVSKKKSLKISNCKSHTIHFGTVNDRDILIDEVLVSVFRSPHSFTGEDSVEISCHGSVFIQQQIIQLILKNGGRLAQPGEFTLRAFLNGKFDLSQAEAVADLIASDSAASHQLAMQQMRGGFSGEIKLLRQQLIHFASLLELELDFAEEDVEFANRDQLKQLISELQSHISQLISSFELGNVIKHGIPVVIAGKPNVGKSTLLNALLNEERAIVSEFAGTTRDTIEEEITLDGIKFRFIDTAGIRETTDAIEKIGVSRTMEKIQQSPVILYLFDVDDSDAKDVRKDMDELRNNIEDERFIVIPVANKTDLQRHDDLKKKYAGLNEIVFISAKEKTNIHQLIQILLSKINKGGLSQGSVIISNARHLEALTKTQEALHTVEEGMQSNRTTDLLANDIKYALHYLGEITGDITTDDLLENIFSRFCIGK